MSEPSLVLRSRRVLTPEGERAAAVRIVAGRIDQVLAYEADPGALPLVDVGTALVMPGVVDSHVHINEPGRTDWEGFETATRAAAAGGITTLVDMPLNSIPVTTSLAALEAKRAAATGQLWVDCGFWGGVVPENAEALEAMIDAGICGFKAFLCPSGIDDFPPSRAEDLRRAMAVLARRGVPLLVHAELEPHGGAAAPGGDPRKYATYLASRPTSWENAAVRLMIGLCRETGCRVHIVHLASAEALPMIRAARAEGLPFSAETCPHYLVFAAEEIPDGATQFKCAPPIREASNREALWRGLVDGTIDFVACDHSPCTVALKLPEEGDFMRAWGGIASVQFSLPVVWSEARKRGLTPADLRPWLCERTAALAGLSAKGVIAPGQDADLVVWNPEARFVLERSRIRFKNLMTPYLDRELYGVVEQTYLRGRLVYERGDYPAGPIGRMLTRDRASAPLSVRAPHR